MHGSDESVTLILTLIILVGPMTHTGHFLSINFHDSIQQKRMSNFVTNRSLLNPKFEGYKLSPLAQDEHILRFPLTALPTQANVSGRSRTPLSFEEVQSRITHNHLAISHDARSAVYVDDDLNVIRVALNSVSYWTFNRGCCAEEKTTVKDLTPTFSKFSELPKPIQTDGAAEDRHKEYPSAASLGGFWLVSDGRGLLYVLSETQEDNRTIALYCLPSNSENTSDYAPFRIHSVRLLSPDTAVCVVSCRHPGDPSPSSDAGSTETKKSGRVGAITHFDVLLVEIPLNARSDEPQVLNVVWKARGDDVPMYVGYDESRTAFFILGKSMYKGVGVITPPTYEPSPDELAPVPRAGEVLPDGSTKPPSYSWTQTPDSVTVAFPLPSNVPKSAIHVTLTAKTLSLLVKHELPTSLPLPRYSLKELWDSINPSSSLWTWDRVADREFGLLTLHLDKQHEGTRWAQVFANAGRSATSERRKTAGTESGFDEDEEVPETLDPSELYAIREALEKYTSALQKGEDASGLGLGRGVPSLAEGELDESVDSSVGRAFAVTWVGLDGRVPPWGAREDAAPSYVLSVPIPGLREPEPSLVVKSDIDGLFFTLPPSSPDPTQSQAATWTHKATYPALAFVLASKRDMRFTFHLSSSLVLGFESGAGLGGGNLYVYHGLKLNKDLWAKQALLKVSGGPSGALLGVGALKLADGDAAAEDTATSISSTSKEGIVLLCLCEKELVVVKDMT